MAGTLLILGDSFCEHEKYWPQQAATALGYADGDCYVSGQPGASMWPVRQHLHFYLENRKEIVKRLTQLIVIHPSPVRIFTSNKEIRANNAILLPMKFNNTDFAEPQLASSLYYKYINDYSFHLWAERNWFLELNTLVGTVPLLNLFTTQASIDNSQDLKGTKVMTPLTELALAVNRSRSHLANDRGLPNHFSQAHNRVFARQIAQIIQGQRVDFDPSEFT